MLPSELEERQLSECHAEMVDLPMVFYEFCGNLMETT